MARKIPARLTPTEGRKFAFTVGTAFLVLGILAWYRHRAGTAAVLCVPGLAFVLAGLMVPSRLGPLQRVWMGAAHAIGRVTTPLFMGMVYFVVFTPLSLIMRLAGRDVLAHRSGAEGYWIRRKDGPDRRSSLEHQF